MLYKLFAAFLRRADEGMRDRLSFANYLAHCCSIYLAHFMMECSPPLAGSV
jgi:hypothetical protein